MNPLPRSEDDVTGDRYLDAPAQRDGEVRFPVQPAPMRHKVRCAEPPGKEGADLLPGKQVRPPR